MRAGFLAAIGIGVALSLGNLQAAETGSPLRPPALNDATGPKNRAELARWLTPKCLAALPDNADRPAGAQWVTEAVAWWLHQDGAPGEVAVIERAEKLPESQRSSPVVQCLLGLARVTRLGPFRDDTLLKVWPQLGNPAAGPAALQWACGVVMRQEVSLGRLPTRDVDEGFLRALGRSLRDECTTDRERWLLLMLPARGFLLDLPYHTLVDHAAALGDIPASIRDTLLGEVRVDAAWSVRGSNVAGKVNPAAWPVYEQHLKLARELLTRAWEADPTSPLAAARMLTVCMGEGASGKESELWLRRALSAQRDSFPAWLAYFVSRWPRWGGSIESIEDAAEEIARTIEWDTDLPRVFELAVSFAGDGGNRQLPEVLESPTMKRAWPVFMRSIPARAVPGGVWNWNRLNTWAFQSMWALGRFDEARELLDRPGWTESNGARREFENAAYSIATARLEVLARTGTTGDVFRTAESAQAAGQSAVAASRYRQAATEAGDALLRTRLEKRAAIAEMESKGEHPGGSPVSSRTIGDLLTVNQGSVRTIDGVTELSADPEQHAIAALWLSSKTRWTLEVTLDLGTQLDGATGVFFGASGGGGGVEILAPDGYPQPIRKRLNSPLTGNLVSSVVATYDAVALRTFICRWDGRQLSVSGSVGDKTWQEAPVTIAADPGVWMFAITASAKHAPLERAIIRRFEFKPLPEDRPGI